MQKNSKSLAPPPGNKALQAQARADFFKTLRDNPINRELFATLKYLKLSEEKTLDYLKSGNADLVLDAMESLKSGKSYAQIGNLEVPETLRGLVGGFENLNLDTPPLEVGKESQFFTVRTLKTRNPKAKVSLIPEGATGKPVLHFEPLPRRFHGVFKGYMVGECVRASCHRYLTAALQDTEIYFVEKSVSQAAVAAGAHRNSQGFIQVVPVKNTQTGEVVGSVDLMSPILRQQGVAVHPKTGKPETLPIFEWWLKSYKKPEGIPNFRGLVLGESSAMSNAGVLPTARGSAGYTFSKPLGSAKDFAPLDPSSNDLFKKIEPFAMDLYKGSWVVDATVSNAGNLRRLTNLDTLSTSDPKVMETLFANIEKIKDPKLKLEIIKSLATRPTWSDSIWQKVPALLADKEEGVSWAMARALKKQLHWPESVWKIVPAVLAHPNTDVKRAIVLALQKQLHWPVIVWQKVPDLLTDSNPDVRWAMVEALKKQPNWPESFWKLVPELLADTNTDVKRAIVLTLQKQLQWPVSFWQKVPDLLANKRPLTSLSMAEALENQPHWPESVWKIVPAVLAHPNTDVKRAIVLALQKQLHWPVIVWQKVPDLLADKDTPTSWSMAKALKSQPHWPETVWEKVPALLADKRPLTSLSMAEALKKQPNWPESTINELAKPGPDGQSLAEKFNLTQELDKRRALPPLTPIQHFDCPLLHQNVAAKMKAL